MARKSSKTTHVLNLLSGVEEKGAKGGEMEDSQPPSPLIPKGAISEVTILANSASIQAATAIQAAPPTAQMAPEPASQPTAHIPVIDMSQGVPDQVGELIRESLMEENKELFGENPDGKERKDSMGMPMEMGEESPEELGTQNLAPEPVPATKPEPTPAPEPAREKEYAYVNVMECIVKEKVLGYMEQFNMCTCDRCVIDTTALSLTRLPPKYIVTNREAVSPLLNYYTSKFTGQVTVELTKACITVKENPKH